MRKQREILRWEEPPTPKGGHGSGDSWQDIADTLRARPGEWAVVDEAAVSSTNANNINSGRVVSFRPVGAYEATSRKGISEETGKTVHVIYARYVGDPA